MVLNRQNIVQWIVYPIALAILIGCIIFALVQMLGMIRASWTVYYLVPICAAAAMEAYWTGRLVEQLPPGSYVTAWHVRAVELACWFLLLQVIADIQMHHRPIDNGIPYVAVGAVAQFVIVVLCWLSATDSARDFYRLADVRPDMVLSFSPAERLTARFFRGGGFLLLFTGLTTIRTSNLGKATTLERPAVGGIIYNVLLYFAVGTVLLVQIRYESLLRTWKMQGIAISSGIPTRWLRYTLALLAIGVAAATVLPTDFTSGVLDVVAEFESVLAIFFGILAFSILLPLAKLLSFLQVASNAPHHPLPPAHVPHSSPTNTHPLSLLTILRSILFWVAVVAAIVYLVRTYASVLPRRGLGGLLRAVLMGLGNLWMNAWNRIRGVQVPGRVVLRRPSRKTRGGVAPPPTRRRTFFPWLLPPRAQIIWYYTGLIQRAGKRGHPRHIGQTPYEYDSALAPHMADTRDDLRSLTQSYVEARYAAGAVTPEQAREVRTVWQRVLAALRRVR